MGSEAVGVALAVTRAVEVSPRNPSCPTLDPTPSRIDRRQPKLAAQVAVQRRRQRRRRRADAPLGRGERRRARTWRPVAAIARGARAGGAAQRGEEAARNCAPGARAAAELRAAAARLQQIVRLGLRARQPSATKSAITSWYVAFVCSTDAFARTHVSFAISSAPCIRASSTPSCTRSSSHVFSAGGRMSSCSARGAARDVAGCRGSSSSSALCAAADASACASSDARTATMTRPPRPPPPPRRGERGAQRRDEVAEVLVALGVRPAAGAAVRASRLHECAVSRLHSATSLTRSELRGPRAASPTSLACRSAHMPWPPPTLLCALALALDVVAVVAFSTVTHPYKPWTFVTQVWPHQQYKFGESTLDLCAARSCARSSSACCCGSRRRGVGGAAGAFAQPLNVDVPPPPRPAVWAKRALLFRIGFGVTLTHTAASARAAAAGGHRRAPARSPTRRRPPRCGSGSPSRRADARAARTHLRRQGGGGGEGRRRRGGEDGEAAGGGAGGTGKKGEGDPGGVGVHQAHRAEGDPSIARMVRCAIRAIRRTFCAIL